MIILILILIILIIIVIIIQSMLIIWKAGPLAHPNPICDLRAELPAPSRTAMTSASCSKAPSSWKSSETVRQVPWITRSPVKSDNARKR